jgi:septal ring factor EnvC (AmiA/AmiB activator)
MRRRLIFPVVLALAGVAGGSVAQEPASAPSQAMIAVQSGSVAGRMEARRQIEALRADLKRLASRQAQSGRDVASARVRLQMLNVRETALTAELGRDRNRLARLLGALQLFRRQPPPALLVRPQDARDAVRAAILIRAMTPALEARAKVYGDEAREIAALRRQAATANADLFTAESLAAERRGDVERALAEQAAIEKRYAADALLAGRDAGSPGQLADSFPRITGPDAGPGPLLKPVDAALTRRFGAELPRGGRAEGVSYAAQSGAVVVSPAQGVVEFAGPVTGWGVILILRTGGAYHLVLGGLSEVTARPGQSVAAGAPVGKTADGGRSGTELYLELRRSGTPVDPSPWLPGGNRRTAATP